MKQQKKLIWQMAILFLFMIVFFGYLIISSNGNPIKESVVKKKLNIYQNENYPLIENDYKVSSMKYDKATRTYSINYIHKKQPKLNFDIIYTKDEKINDTYYDNIIKGKQLFDEIKSSMAKEINNQISSLDINKKFTNFNIEIKNTLDNLDEKNLILEGFNINNLKIFYLTLEIEVLKLDIETYTEYFIKLHEEIKKLNNNSINGYSIKFIDKENNKIFIHKVNIDLIEQGKDKLIEIFTQLKTNKEIVEQKYNITYE